MYNREQMRETGNAPALTASASLLDAQPALVRNAFNYCVCLLMVEAGKMRLVEKVLGENSVRYVFETTVHNRFSVAGYQQGVGGGPDRRVAEDFGGGETGES